MAGARHYTGNKTLENSRRFSGHLPDGHSTLSLGISGAEQVLIGVFLGY